MVGGEALQRNDEEEVVPAQQRPLEVFVSPERVCAYAQQVPDDDVGVLGMRVWRGVHGHFHHAHAGRGGGPRPPSPWMALTKVDLPEPVPPVTPMSSLTFSRG